MTFTSFWIPLMDTIDVINFTYSRNEVKDSVVQNPDWYKTIAYVDYWGDDTDESLTAVWVDAGIAYACGVWMGEIKVFAWYVNNSTKKWENDIIYEIGIFSKANSIWGVLNRIFLFGFIAPDVEGRPGGSYLVTLNRTTGAILNKTILHQEMYNNTSSDVISGWKIVGNETRLYSLSYFKYGSNGTNDLILTEWNIESTCPEVSNERTYRCYPGMIFDANSITSVNHKLFFIGTTADTKLHLLAWNQSGLDLILNVTWNDPEQYIQSTCYIVGDSLRLYTAHGFYKAGGFHYFSFQAWDSQNGNLVWEKSWIPPDYYAFERAGALIRNNMQLIFVMEGLANSIMGFIELDPATGVTLSYRTWNISNWNIHISDAMMENDVLIVCGDVSPFYYVKYDMFIAAWTIPMYNPPPTINHPSDRILDLDQSTQISWTVNDLLNTNKTYLIIKNGSSAQQGSWNANESISINTGMLSAGLYNYTIVVDDGLGGIVKDTVMIWVNALPSINHPIDSTINEEHNTTISWIVNDLLNNNTSYSILKNGSSTQQGSWNANESISINTGMLSAGLYNYTIVVDDGLGGIVKDTVMVWVNGLPIINHPSDILVSENNTTTISWMIIDLYNTITSYSIYINGIDVQQGIWQSNLTISIISNRLPPGVYNYTIIAYDGLGGAVSDTVIVTVQRKADVGGPLSNNGLTITIALITASIAALLLIRSFVRKKHPANAVQKQSSKKNNLVRKDAISRSKKLETKDLESQIETMTREFPKIPIAQLCEKLQVPASMSDEIEATLEKMIASGKIQGIIELDVFIRYISSTRQDVD